MPGTRPGIHVCQLFRMAGGWAYIVSNQPNGILYVGVTAKIRRRAWEHREGVVEGVSQRYGLQRLVFVERHDDTRPAIQRGKAMKHCSRAGKVRLLLAADPEWADLYETLA